MRPIFIGGVPRSGTTMLGSMLGAHPRHVAVPEMQFKIDLLDAAGPDGRLEGGDAAAVIAHLPRFRAWGVDASVLGRLERPTVREVVDALVRAYAERVGKPDPVVWVDHTPRNMNFAATISEAFPDGRFVHILRDGRAVAASLLRVDWGPGTIDGAAEMWLRRLSFALAAEAAHEGVLPVVRVRFEDVVAAPESTLVRLCEELELEYDPAMAEAGGFTPPPSSRSIHTLVGSPPATDRTDAWRRELTPRQVEIFESIANDALRMVGYRPDFGTQARTPTRRERYGFRVRELVARPVRRARRRRRWRLDA